MKGGSCVGVVYTYKHGVRGLVEKLLKIQHKHSEVIKAVFHAHLNKKMFRSALGNREYRKGKKACQQTKNPENRKRSIFLPVKMKGMLER